MNNTNKDVLPKNVLTAALNDYLAYIQIDSLGDVTPQVNAAKALINYISTNDDITADWVKSNWIILLPAIDYHRNSLKESIHNAILDNDEDKLSALRAENRNLQPFLNLLKPFRTLTS